MVKAWGIYIRKFPPNGIQPGIGLIRLSISTLGHINALTGNAKRATYGLSQLQYAPTTILGALAAPTGLQQKWIIFLKITPN
jgi:hypothetical protein